LKRTYPGSPSSSAGFSGAAVTRNFTPATSYGSGNASMARPIRAGRGVMAASPGRRVSYLLEDDGRDAEV
jgi:hypothetical protein